MAPKKHQQEVDRFLYDLLSTPIIDSMKFTDAFKQGMSDGKVHVYFTNTHTFHTGLLEMVVKAFSFKQLDYTVKVIDKRPPRVKGDVTDIKWNHHYDLRAYQIGVGRNAIKKNGILQVPTGGGKTVIGASLIRHIIQTTCFVVTSKHLLYQAQKDLTDILGYKVGIVGDSKVIPKNITVCSIQTLYSVLDAHRGGKQRVSYNPKKRKFETEKLEYDKNKIDKIIKLIDETTHVIFDEVHHLSAETYTEVARAFKNATWRHGLSATAWRNDKKEIMMHQLLGPIIAKISLDRLIKEGFLVQPRIEFLEPSTPPGMTRKYSKKVEREYFVNNPKRNATIVNKIIKMIDDGYESILVICQLIDHVETLEAMLYEAGVKVETIIGEVPQNKRETRLERFNDGSNVLIATDMFGEGFNMPKVDGVVFAQIYSDPIKVYQYVGRALRQYKDKDHSLIVDVADRFKWFGNWFEKRLGVYAIEPAFRENIVSERWDMRIDLVAAEADLGENRVIVDHSLVKD